MKGQATRKRTWIIAGVLLAVLLAWAATKAGRFLIVDAPQPSDLIVVLAGETDKRPARALELLAQGYGQRIVLDVPVDTNIYEFTQIQLAEKYIRDIPQAKVSVCPIEGLSTQDESKDVEKCIARESVNKVLIVTSDFHTRRALSVFRREAPGHEYSVAASRNSQQFGAKWWQHRQWAKTFVDEWLRFMWWKVVDQWR